MKLTGLLTFFYRVTQEKSSFSGEQLEGRVLTWAIWSNLPKSWLSVSTNSEAVSFSDNGVKLTMSAYKMLKKEKKVGLRFSRMSALKRDGSKAQNKEMFEG